MGKEKSAVVSTHKHRHNPLHKDIVSDNQVETRHRSRQGKHDRRRANKLQSEEFVDSNLSKKIVSIAQEQQREIESETNANTTSKSTYTRQLSVFGSTSFDPDSDDDGTKFDNEDEDEWDGGNDDILEVDAEELKMLETFFPEQPATRQTLADIIADKIAQYEAASASNGNSDPSNSRTFETNSLLNPKVIEVYTKVGKLMSRYKSGKLPKAFKIVPSMPQWEDILYLTRPDTWTPHATYEATRIFVSNLNPKLAQRFLNLFLLEKVREEIHSSRKLSHFMYRALKKAIYKPAAFFKGILLPLVDGGCSLREAAIVGSVVAKVSVPVLHSAACMMKLADMEYSGAASLFLRILLDKKYALPYKVVDAIVFHFLRFKSQKPDQIRLPVLWHQALLVFSQRYKQDITSDQKDALLDLLKFHSHYAITPEIRRELMSSVSRGTSSLPSTTSSSNSMTLPVLNGLVGVDVEMVDV